MVYLSRLDLRPDTYQSKYGIYYHNLLYLQNLRKKKKIIDVILEIEILEISMSTAATIATVLFKNRKLTSLQTVLFKWFKQAEQYFCNLNLKTFSNMPVPLP